LLLVVAVAEARLVLEVIQVAVVVAPVVSV
jgi:hypothetical protein